MNAAFPDSSSSSFRQRRNRTGPVRFGLNDPKHESLHTRLEIYSARFFFLFFTSSPNSWFHEKEKEKLVVSRGNDQQGNKVSVPGPSSKDWNANVGYKFSLSVSFSLFSSLLKQKKPRAVFQGGS